MKARVLLAVKYTDQFAYPLTATEIWQRLPLSGSRNMASRQQVEAALVELKNLGLVKESEGFWALASRNVVALKKQRERRGEYSQTKMLEAAKLFGFLRWLPWVSGAAVTGSVSMDNAKRDDDIDFMIITPPRRLWLARPLVTAYAWFNGKRRSWHREESNSWCFNMWLDEDNLSMPPNTRNYYSAYEVFQARWVINKRGVKERFLRRNRWAARIFPHMVNLDELGESKSAAAWLSILFGPFFNLLNFLAYRGQLWYMQPHRTTEKVGLGFAFFHPRDTYLQVAANLLKLAAPTQLPQLPQHLTQLLQNWHDEEQTLVLVTGVFDLLHHEHLNFLRKAKKTGDKLIVGLESDARVKQLKGKNRPINPENIRHEKLAQLNLADFIFILPDDFSQPAHHRQLIAAIRPNILAVSSHTKHLEKKQAILQEFGGRVEIIHQHNPGISTTLLIEQGQV